MPPYYFHVWGSPARAENGTFDVFSGNFVPNQTITTNASNTFATTGIWFINSGENTLNDTTLFQLAFDDILFDDGTGEVAIGASDITTSEAPQFLSKPLVYPSPVKFSRNNAALGLF